MKQFYTWFYENKYLHLVVIVHKLFTWTLLNNIYLNTNHFHITGTKCQTILVHIHASNIFFVLSFDFRNYAGVIIKKLDVETSIGFSYSYWRDFNKGFL